MSTNINNEQHKSTERSRRRPSSVREKRTAAKPDERGRLITGSVTRILYGQGHGFIRTQDTGEVYFHRSEVAHKRFNALDCGDRVEFELIEDKIAGPRAVRVRRL